MSTNAPEHAIDNLSDDDRSLLVAAHERLNRAVEQYQPFLDRRRLKNGEIQGHPRAAILRAQQAVADAEANLWQLREQLLGWRRPSSGFNATWAADWFSPEDRVYDNFPPSPS